MEERRDYRRKQVDINAVYKGSSETFEKGQIKDISYGGMFIETDSPLDEGTLIIASLDASDFGKIIRVQGHVIRVTTKGAGIKFTSIDKKGVETITSYRS
ncbi:MAG: PilZ domain-containing protein [Deltaproteobacteria bacterium]|nr:PilZ domain-containing protein [Deltaproteobacteria bacterium]